MDEQEWMRSSDPAVMLADLLRWREYHPHFYSMSDRKLRLFACAAARLTYAPLHTDREAVIVIAEEVADGLHDKPVGRLIEARKSIDAVYGWIWCATCPDIAVGLRQTVYHEKKRTPPFLANLFREIVGNPFQHPGKVSLQLRQLPDVRRLAHAAYDERVDGVLDLHRLAVLADALEEVGCNDDGILRHLRSPGPHFRGCYVVDLLTGRE